MTKLAAVCGKVVRLLGSVCRSATEEAQASGSTWEAWEKTVGRWPEPMYWIAADGSSWVSTVDGIDAERRGLDDFGAEHGYMWADHEDGKVYYMPPLRMYIGTPRQRRKAARWVQKHRKQIEEMKCEVEIIELEP